MKQRQNIKALLLIAGVSIGVLVVSQFAVSSTRMAIMAATQYIQNCISSK